METPTPHPDTAPHGCVERDVLLRDIARREARALAQCTALRDERDRALAAAAAARAERDRAIAAAEAARTATAAAREAAAAAIESREATMQAVLASTSWRITAPLRAMMRRLRPGTALFPLSEGPPAETARPPGEDDVPAGPDGAEAPPADPPPQPGPIEEADQRVILGLDLALPAMALAVVVADGPMERLRGSLAAAMAGLPGQVTLHATLEDAFAAGAELALVAPGDAALDPECLRRLAQAHLAADGRAILEAAAFPDEGRRPFDIQTFEIPWLSGHGWALPRPAWEATGGPDGALGSAAAAAVDLGWRARACGFALRLVPHALLLAPFAAPGEADAATLASRWGNGAAATLTAARWP